MLHRGQSLHSVIFSKVWAYDHQPRQSQNPAEGDTASLHALLSWSGCHTPPWVQNIDTTLSNYVLNLWDKNLSTAVKCDGIICVSGGVKLWIARCGETMQGICPYGLALDLQSLLDACSQPVSKTGYYMDFWSSRSCWRQEGMAHATATSSSHLSKAAWVRREQK